MATLHPYLNFEGNTEEAFQFYQSVFGGKFRELVRYRDMPSDVPGGDRIAEEDKEKILHVSLPIGRESVLMGTDVPASMGPPLVAGNNFHLYVDAQSPDEAEKLFAALAAGGKVEMPLGKVFWGALFGMLTDRFGIQWMISYQEKP